MIPDCPECREPLHEDYVADVCVRDIEIGAKVWVRLRMTHTACESAVTVEGTIDAEWV